MACTTSDYRPGHDCAPPRKRGGAQADSFRQVPVVLRAGALRAAGLLAGLVAGLVAAGLFAGFAAALGADLAGAAGLATGLTPRPVSDWTGLTTRSWTVSKTTPATEPAASTSLATRSSRFTVASRV